ncbi:FtsX-like permease family protein [Lactobacillus sp. PV012]|uniref:FtsX-like permease family protein n=1 Tax=Lactobacillus sp. PV012 TaxID=2594494 RepID=UPI002240BDA1|nr:FtsX-like permease family protein [Lactobacillus sp. PV012]QNQ82780.1 FtsX-like permease family protein [Lactobacillus sp. PV012]
MLIKLALNGIKTRFKDYLILFSGLTLASAIFYMFLSIALNQSFLKSNVAVVKFSMTQQIFKFGIALLAIIILIYLIYANNFLLSMRKKTYGTYMMLGARPAKIGILIFVETLIVGLVATGIGIVIGIGLTQWVATLLVKSLGLLIHQFIGFYFPAIIGTGIFFTALFFLAALWNRRQLVNTKIILLLKEDTKPVQFSKNKIWHGIEALLGIGLLALGYWAIFNIIKLKNAGIGISFFAIVVGTYFTFDAVFSVVIDMLRTTKQFHYHKLHSFTLGQLKFRLKSYTRLLSVISLLFALALGAITVGLNFNRLTDEQLQSVYYDAILYQKDAAVKKQLKKIEVQHQAVISVKEVGKDSEGNARYYVSEESIDQGIKTQKSYEKNGQYKFKTVTYSLKQVMTENSDQNIEFAQFLPKLGAKFTVVSTKKFAQTKGKTEKIYLLKLAHFKQNFANIKKLQALGLAGMPTDFKNSLNTKVDIYETISGLAAGFEFMGFFLGLAFLAMLASTLMFKVLSGAAQDVPRYRMLEKIGVQSRMLTVSIFQEIGVLFALPALLGVLDVICGLQLFKIIFANPYNQIWIPFTLFGVLYVIYYIITVLIYRAIVLSGEKYNVQK